MYLRALSAPNGRSARFGILLIGVGAMIGMAFGRPRVRAAAAALERANIQAVRHAQLLQAILDSSIDGIAVVDGQGQSILHNPAAQGILGALDDSGTERWQAHYGIYHPDGQTRFASDELPLVRALAGQASEQVAMLIRNEANPAGAVISVCAQPLTDPNGRHGAVAIFHDVTDLRRHEADLAAFAGIVAHDLKSPLTAIMGFTELARDNVADLPAVALPMLDRVLANSQRMSQLIDDLLSFASARHGVLTAIDLDLRAVVDEIVNERFAAIGLAADGLAPQAHIGALEPVHADPGMVRQLLGNLIGNALKYTPPGQSARLDVSSVRSRSGWVRIEIADRGIGIPTGQHHAIFEDFHRAHQGAGYDGTGLGLAICDRIVARHGGEIGVLDNLGGGSRFWFTLPAADAATGLNSRPQVPNVVA